jgi:hypothetical protein
MTISEILLQTVQPLLAAGLAAIWYLVRHYFKKIHDDIHEVKISLARHDGRSESLQKEIRENTTAMVALRSEVNAMWHFVDNSKRRATDLSGR